MTEYIVEFDHDERGTVTCLSCGHHIEERPCEVYCNIMCKWVKEKDYCTMFEPAHTMEEFMYGQDLGSPEDGSL